MVPYFETDLGKLFLGDCNEIMEQVGNFDLCLTDPPYGIGMARNSRLGSGRKTKVTVFKIKSWDDSTPDDSTFDLIKSISKNQIVFGGNYFSLGPSPCWIVWDKVNGKNKFADCELAWTSFKTATRMIKYQWHGMLKKAYEKRYHPTQKPVGLFREILSMYASKGQTIIDPFAGSGTTALACESMGLEWVLIEKDEEYCDIVCERLTKYNEQLRLFS